MHFHRKNIVRMRILQFGWMLMTRPANNVNSMEYVSLNVHMQRCKWNLKSLTCRFSVNRPLAFVERLSKKRFWNAEKKMTTRSNLWKSESRMSHRIPTEAKLHQKMVVGSRKTKYDVKEENGRALKNEVKSVKGWKSVRTGMSMYARQKIPKEENEQS